MRVIAVQLQDVHPPKEVSDAFKDVASAREDKSRIINEAEAYRNELIPKARGLARRGGEPGAGLQGNPYPQRRGRSQPLPRAPQGVRARPRTSRSSACILKLWKKFSAVPAWKSSFSRRTPPIACCRCCRSCNPPRPPGRLRPKNNLPEPHLPEATLSRPRGNN